MKHMTMILMMVSVFLMAACSSLSSNERAADAADSGKPTESMQVQKSARTSEPSAGRIRIQDGAGIAMLQKVAFRPGVSSASVERLAKRADCTGGAGAGLITEKGPVEVYRMQCDNGKMFMAQCELRQCRAMP